MGLSHRLIAVTGTGRSRRAPGPRGDFLLGNLREFRRDALSLLMRCAQEYGDVVRCRIGPYVMHLVNHPDHVDHVLQHNSRNYDRCTRSAAKIRSACGNGLLTSDGDLWRQQRRLLQPSFSAKSLATVGPAATAATLRILEEWERRDKHAAPIDIGSEMKRLTSTVAARVFFGSEIAEESSTIERALEILLTHTWSRLESIFDVARFFPTSGKRRFRKALADLDAIVGRVIEERSRAATQGQDLLAALLAAGGTASHEQLRDEVITMLLAGHETTANALARTFYLLAIFPEAERRVKSELREVLGSRMATANDLDNLKYLTMVWNESLRLYPPIWIIERRAIRSDEIGGFKIPAHSSVLISPYALHRHTGFWKNSEGFDPERFSPERLTPTAMRSYLPFGAGPHQCIGREFAMLEARLIIATLLQNHYLDLVPGQPFQLRPGITLGLRHPLMMTFHQSTDERSDS